MSGEINGGGQEVAAPVAAFGVPSTSALAEGDAELAVGLLLLAGDVVLVLLHAASASIRVSPLAPIQFLEVFIVSELPFGVPGFTFAT